MPAAPRVKTCVLDFEKVLGTPYVRSCQQPPFGDVISTGRRQCGVRCSNMGFRYVWDLWRHKCCIHKCCIASGVAMIFLWGWVLKFQGSSKHTIFISHFIKARNPIQLGIVSK